MAAAQYSKLDEDHRNSEAAPLSEDSSTALYDEPLEPEKVPRLATRRSGRLREPLQALGLACLCTVFFALGFVAHAQFRGVDELACLDTAWGEFRHRPRFCHGAVTNGISPGQRL